MKKIPKFPFLQEKIPKYPFSDQVNLISHFRIFIISENGDFYWNLLKFTLGIPTYKNSEIIILLKILNIQ